MTSARLSTKQQRRALKIAAQLVVQLCGGGKVASQITAADPATLSLYGAPQEPLRHMRVDVALDLDLAAGEPIMARALATAQGWMLVRDEATACPLPLGLADYSNLHREAFEAKSSLLDVIQRATMTDAQRRDVLRELAELRRAIAVVEAKIEGAE